MPCQSNSLSQAKSQRSAKQHDQEHGEVAAGQVGHRSAIKHLCDSQMQSTMDISSPQCRALECYLSTAATRVSKEHEKVGTRPYMMFDISYLTVISTCEGLGFAQIVKELVLNVSRQMIEWITT
jgi:hypothetical protein